MTFQWNKRGMRAVSAVMCGAMLWGSIPAAMAADTEEIVIEAEDNSAESGWNLLDVIEETAQPQLSYMALNGGQYRLFNAASGQVLTTKGRGGADGAEIVCRTNETMTTQVYQLEQAEDGSFQLGSCTAKGMVLNADGSGVVQQKKTGSDGERFYAVQEDNGTVSIRSAANPALALTQSGSSVSVEEYRGESAQQWTLKKINTIHKKTISSGIYTIDSAKYDKSMQVSGSSLTMNSKTISDGQKFQVKYVGDGKYTIRAYSGNGKRVTASKTAGSSVKLANTTCRYYIDKKSDGTYAIIRAGTKYTAVQALSSGVTTTSYDGGKSQSWTFDSKVVEDETKATQTLNKVLARYPSGTWLGSGYTFAGGYQCMGFGREVFYRTFGTETRWSYDGSPKSSVDGSNYTVAARSSSYSASSMKKLIAKASPGDVLQMNSPKIHTMIYLGSDSDGFTVYDANWTGANQVNVRHVSYGAWSGRNSSGICVLHSTNYPAK